MLQHNCYKSVALPPVAKQIATGAFATSNFPYLGFVPLNNFMCDYLVATSTSTLPRTALL